MKALWLFTIAGCLFAQSASAPLTFDVASVKPSGETRGGFTDFLPGGGFQATGATLKTLITLAYEINAYQLSGGPSWLDSARFDILARPDPPGVNQQIRERLRNLLADRFQLVIHRETKELPVYALVVAKNGPRLQQSNDGKSLMSGSRGRLAGQRVGTNMLAAWLSGHVGRPVIDKTGLTGRYDFDLRWAPDDKDPGDLPSIFTALPEQLGLRLESEKGPVEMLVIDRAEKPSQN